MTSVSRDGNVYEELSLSFLRPAWCLWIYRDFIPFRDFVGAYCVDSGEAHSTRNSRVNVVNVVQGVPECSCSTIDDQDRGNSDGPLFDMKIYDKASE